MEKQTENSKSSSSWNHGPEEKIHSAKTGSISLPKGGGAIKGIGEKFAANPVTGTGSVSVPIATSPGRSGFGPELSLSYDSGAGNGPFGFGWNLALPSITRKTDKGLPQYHDGSKSKLDGDVFILSGAEDMVPEYQKDDLGNWIIRNGTHVIHDKPRTINGIIYRVRRYRPRIEGLFARIERWTNQDDPHDVFWRSITRDNITTWYGKDENSRIADPADPVRIFSWLICESHDDKGNVMVYRYREENSAGVDHAKANEHNRTGQSRTANRYIKRIYYGNHKPYYHLTPDNPWPSPTDAADEGGSAAWHFELVFDYGEHNLKTPTPAGTSDWNKRTDPFSTYRPGFEVRTMRLCRRVLMFHHFPDEESAGNDCLVRSTDFTYSHDQDPEHVRNPVYTFMQQVTQSGYKRKEDGSYLKKSLPPLEFEYSEPVVKDKLEKVDTESLENLPNGLDGAIYQWTDLHGEGIPGILTEQGGGWFYKRNLSPINEKRSNGKRITEPKFASVEQVVVKPNLSLTDGAQFMDLAGDGLPDLVVMDGPMPGLYEHDGDEGWQPFRPFTSRLNRDMHDPNLKFIDLDGDGHADVLITEDNAFIWHASLAEEGFGSARRVVQTMDEEKCPRMVFNDGTQSVYLADMSGDGLTDLARIRNGEFCYWPNLGYGRFGAKITMDHAPHYDNPDQFDHKRIRLADIDGTGTNDIIYLHRNGDRLYFNQSGNSWSEPQHLKVFPRIDNLANIMPVDLLGNGTACLVWSSSLPGDATHPIKYVNLIGDQKPHLLINTINNLGAETHVLYATSTKFYLKDKLDGKPWITRLPFQVHVVERVETYDRISHNRFVTRYAYHHGYFDGEEREFRGFGMVEQWDTEEISALKENDNGLSGCNEDYASHVPPKHTKTWFHTGVYVDREHISLQYEKEYYREPGLSPAQFKEFLLPDTHLPDGLTIQEEREACRALKGMMLRQEVYADDDLPGSPPEIIQRAKTPYTVVEQDFTIRPLQPRSENRHAVFFTHPREIITYHYERNPVDPRVQHALTLEVDDYGNVLKEAAIGYGRRQPDASLPTDEDRIKQTQKLVSFTENSVTNTVEEADAYRAPLPCEALTFELTGYTPTGPNGRYRAEDFVEPDTATPYRLRHKYTDEIAYEVNATANPCRRQIERTRTLYRKNDMTAELPLGEIESRALPGESYQLAFTPGLLSKIFQRNGQPLLATRADIMSGHGADQGGYIDLDNNEHWWIPSGRVYFHPDADIDDPSATAAQELDQAKKHFFRVRKSVDQFKNSALVDYDDYDLFEVRTQDALGNITEAVIDYRVLQPKAVIDFNENHTEVAYDTLGMLAGTAVKGKVDSAGNTESGDSLDGFETDVSTADLEAFLNNPKNQAPNLLGKATTRIIYDVNAYYHSGDSNQPVYAATLARERHVAEVADGELSPVQVSFSYSDGFGREIQQKIQAEKGPVPRRNAEGRITVDENNRPEMTDDDVEPRWVGSGWTVFNNKGKPVRQYEPFFTDTHHFEFDTKIGVSPVLFYDPVDRVIATLHPNHTYEKVVFGPWKQTTWDVNDTCAVRNHQTGDPRTDPDISGYVDAYFKALPDDPSRPWQTWYEQRHDGALGAEEQKAAHKAAAHADTPTTAHLDTLSRPFLTIAKNRVTCPNHQLNGSEEDIATRVELDIEGNQRSVSDALGRMVMKYDYMMAGPSEEEEGPTNLIHQHSMEAGERWMLNDVYGNPIRAWDSRGFARRMTYDQLRRPLGLYVTGADPANPGHELLCEKVEYGEDVIDKQLNMRTRVLKQYDEAGIVTLVGKNPENNKDEGYDFKGNPLRSQRQLLKNYKDLPDWNLVEPEVFVQATSYDALNRVISATTPDNSRVRYTYNDAALLEKVDANLRGKIENDQLVWTPFVKNIDYDAKGQRQLIEYGNGAITRYEYDPFTFRLTHLLTTRGAGFPQACETELHDAERRQRECPKPQPKCKAIQNLFYTYDPAGNITHIRDDAQQTVFFRNKCVEPSADYTYDAIYRLIEAAGREHLGQTNGQPNPPKAPDAFNGFHARLDHPGDGNAMGLYMERYVYDAVGNFLKMQHRGSDPIHPGWTRSYEYDERSLIESGKMSNRLSNAPLNSDPTSSIKQFTYDAHGNMTRMPHLPLMRWDCRDQLQATARQVVTNGGTPETTWYVYDSAGQRVRKITERQALAGQTPTQKEERIYLGGFEIYRKYESNGNNTVALDRETLHVMDDQERIALVETKTKDTGKSNDDTELNKPLVRYQFGNHLGSASLDLDEKARIISYEEYYPYGNTSHQTVSKTIKAAAKRYRYSGKERDEESGLYYYGARYYSPSFIRWVSYDKLYFVDGPNLYCYVRVNPISHADQTGHQAKDISAGYDRFPDLEDYETVSSIISAGKEFTNEQHELSRILYNLSTHIDCSIDIPHVNAILNELLTDLSTLLQMPLSEIEQDWQRLQRLYRTAESNKPHNPIEKLPRQSSHWASVDQLRFGKVLGDALGLSPVLAVLLSPTGGMLGPGYSPHLHNALPQESIRIHGAVHDAAGYLYNYHERTGPGYQYRSGTTSVILDTSNPLSGQISGISFWILKLAERGLLNEPAPTVLPLSRACQVSLTCVAIKSAYFAGYKLGEQWNKLLSDDVQMIIGGTITEILEHGSENTFNYWFGR